MAKIVLKCKSCGKEVEREEKPAPKTKAEMKQILFNCPCGATNYRDGTAAITKKKVKKPVKTGQKPVNAPDKPEPVNPVKVLREATVTPIELPTERSDESNEEESSSPLII